MILKQIASGNGSSYFTNANILERCMASSWDMDRWRTGSWRKNIMWTILKDWEF